MAVVVGDDGFFFFFFPFSSPAEEAFPFSLAEGDGTLWPSADSFPTAAGTPVTALTTTALEEGTGAGREGAWKAGSSASSSSSCSSKSFGLSSSNLSAAVLLGLLDSMRTSLIVCSLCCLTVVESELLLSLNKIIQLTIEREL